MLRRFTKKRTLVALCVIAVLGIAGAAIAYFTDTGSGTGQATVGTSSHWSVTFGTTTGTMYPGSGTSTVNYTVTNASSGHQFLNSTTATVVDTVGDGTGDITDHGTPVTGCKASWFTASNNSPAAADLAGGGSENGSVDVTMSNDATHSQDSCKGAHPDIRVNAS